MSCDIGCLPLLLHSTAEWSCSVIQSCRCKPGSQTGFSFCVWSVGQWSILPPQKTAQGCDDKLFLLYMLLAIPTFFQLLFFQTHLLYFYIPPPSSIPLWAMLLKGFLLFCNEGSWCCQQCLAASPAFPFYSGPVKNVWSPRAKSLHPVSRRSFTADIKNVVFINDLLEWMLPET